MSAHSPLDRSIPPTPRPMEKVPFPEVSRHELNNGIPVYTVQFGTQEIVELSATFRAGRSFEPQIGVASFTANMMQEGTRSYTGLEFARKLNEFGAFISSETGYESATWKLSSLTKHIETTIGLLSEVVSYPTFPAADLEKLKTRTLERLDVEEKKTGYRARKEFNRLLHSTKNPYGRSAGKEEVQAIQLEQLIAFHERYFSLANAFFVACGRFDETALLAHLNTQFGSKELDPSLYVDPALSNGRIVTEKFPVGLHYFELKDSMQATVRVGHRGFPRQHPDYHRMQVLNTVLGGYFGSRLMKNIREEKGYTYGIGSAWLSMKYSGSFLVQTDVGNEYIKATLAEIKKEIQLLIEEGIAEEELNLVKNYMLGRSASSRETPEQIASTIRTCLINEIPFTDLDEKFDIVKSVQTSDIQALAQEYLHPNQMLEVVAGKMEQSE